MEKIALLVVYNHRFDRNIPVIEKLYDGKFTHVFHVIPFYDGNKENVIPVYESSYNFQGYIAQAYTHIKRMGFTHYFVVADDMLLHPDINEHTLWDVTGLKKNDCFITSLIVMQEREKIWPRTWEALAWRKKTPGVEIDNVLPSEKDAANQFRKYNLPWTKFSFSKVWTSFKLFRRNLKEFYRFRTYFEYPLVGGYSDILLITDECMSKFCQYCGAFAATNLFVEVAAPTSLVLASDNVMVCEDIKLKDGALWCAEDMAFLEKYNYSLSALQEDFPSDKLFLHPIKLSKWK